MIIGGIIVSSLEFPGKISLVIFTGGCTLRCPYCHNPELIEGGDEVDMDQIKAEIFDSLDFIDGVVITGGEPLIQFEDVRELLRYSKELGLKVKIDTNGCFPDKLKKIIKWVDYVALDIKAPFDRYKEIINADIGNKVKESMEITKNSPDTYLECRTTYVPGLLDGDDLLKMAKSIKCDLFTIQQFRNKVVLDEKLKETQNPSRDELLKIAKEVKPFLKKVNIKTAEFGVETP
jgi:pyruvate formate lyase activating enzyme